MSLSEDEASPQRTSLRRTLRSVFHFGVSSVGCMILDKAIFSLLCILLEGAAGRARAIIVSLAAARFVSGNANYAYNARFVFKSRASLSSYVKYWALAGVNVAVSAGATVVLAEMFDVHGLAITAVNFAVDVALFIASYSIQRIFIFKEGRD